MLRSMKDKAAGVSGLTKKQMDQLLSHLPKGGRRIDLSDDEEDLVTQIMDRQSMIVHDKEGYIALTGVEPVALWGLRLATARRYCGLAQGDIGKACGVSREAANQYERAKGNAPENRSHRERIALRLGIPLHFLDDGFLDEHEKPVGKMQPQPERRKMIADCLGVPLAFLEDGNLDGVSPDSPIGLLVGKSQEKAAALLHEMQRRRKLRPADDDEARRMLAETEIAKLAREAGGYWSFSGVTNSDFRVWGKSIKESRVILRGEVGADMTKRLDAAIEQGVFVEGRQTRVVWKEFCARCEEEGIQSPAEQTAFSSKRRIAKRRAALEKNTDIASG